MANILLVDDNHQLLGTMTDYLQRAGHQVTPAANGKVALALIGASRYDLVITDLYMPEKEGLETILELRKKHPTMKIIAMSGGGPETSTNLLMAERFGAALTLKKPFTGSALVLAVESLIPAAGVG